MQPSSFRGNDVIAGLVTLAGTTLTGVKVIDGPPAAKLTGTDFLFIGWDPTNAFHVIERRVASDENTFGRDTAEGEVACSLDLRTGNTKIEPLRRRAVQMLTDLEMALRADRDGLGGSCDYAGLDTTTIGLTQYQVSEGAQIHLEFSVWYQAFI